MKKHQHITAFYVETLLLIGVFVAVILVLTHVFGIGRSMSGQARRLNDAVCLAQNAAEAVSAARSPEDVIALLDQGGNVRAVEGGIEAGYDGDRNPDTTRAPALRVEITWEPDGKGLVSSAITVYHGPEAVYSLDTAVYTGEGEP